MLANGLFLTSTKRKLFLMNSSGEKVSDIVRLDGSQKHSLDRDISSQFTRDEKNALENLELLEREETRRIVPITGSLVLVLSSAKLYLVEVITESDPFTDFMKNRVAESKLEIVDSIRMEEPLTDEEARFVVFMRSEIPEVLCTVSKDQLWQLKLVQKVKTGSTRLEPKIERSVLWEKPLTTFFMEPSNPSEVKVMHTGAKFAERLKLK